MVTICCSDRSCIIPSHRLRQVCQNQNSERVQQNANRRYLNSWELPNSRKYVSTEALDPVTGETVPLYNPRRHRWLEHFAWNEDYILVMGVPQTGRATVE